MTAPLPAGWFADPGGSDAERWWDGQEWTTQVRPKGASAERTASVQPSGRVGYSPSTTSGRFPVLKAIVILLGVVAFFLGFAPYISFDNGPEITLDKSSWNFFNMGSGVVGLAALLAAALIAAFSLLPRQSPQDGVVAGLAVTGFVSLLSVLFGLPKGISAGVGLVLVLVASFLQMICALMIVLTSSGVVRLGSPPS